MVWAEFNLFEVYPNTFSFMIYSPIYVGDENLMRKPSMLYRKGGIAAYKRSIPATITVYSYVYPSQSQR